MDFFVQIIRSLIEFIFLAAVAVGGVFLGKFARERKNSKQSKGSYHSTISKYTDSAGLLFCFLPGL